MKRQWGTTKKPVKTKAERVVETTIWILFALLLGTAAVLFWVHDARSQEVPSLELTLAWDPNTEFDHAGYRLYNSPESGEYTDPPIADIPAGTEMITVTVPNALSFFVMRAYDTAGNESVDSNEVNSAEANPTAPGLRVVKTNKTTTTTTTTTTTVTAIEEAQ